MHRENGSIPRRLVRPVGKSRKRFDLRIPISIFCASLCFAQVEADWLEHTDSELRVSFRCPKEWKQNPVYKDRVYLDHYDEQGRFIGSVQLIASEGDAPMQVCRGYATHKLLPAGAHPRLQPMKLQGQKACLVWPSKEQGRNIYRGNADALLVVEYPRGVKIGDSVYGQLMVFADQDHILEIGRAIRFLDTGKAVVSRRAFDTPLAGLADTFSGLAYRCPRGPRDHHSSFDARFRAVP